MKKEIKEGWYLIKEYKEYYLCYKEVHGAKIRECFLKSEVDGIDNSNVPRKNPYKKW